MPTQYELCELARHYHNFANQSEYDCLVSACCSGSDMNREAFAWERLGTIRELVGNDAIDLALWKEREDWKRAFEELATFPHCQRCGITYPPEESCNCKS